MPTKKPMTGWYNPVMLVRTAIRVAVSTAFGEFADRREAMAAANAIAPQPLDARFVYEAADEDGAFWFDFLADTGDGWDSTFAMAQLVTQPALSPNGSAGPLRRGRVLLLGGDQVYPTASKEDYDNRFLYPFDTAYARTTAKADMPDLYAIPGNHDWYDGLGAFFNLFCRRRIAPKEGMGVDRPGRVIAGRQTQQTRSYFAIKLPNDWWVWGTDSQLKGYIDQPQIDYFQHVARYWMKPGSKLILLVGQPNWAYVDPDHPEREFETFSYLERLAGIARDEHDQPMGHRLKLVVTGDSHHYSRYEEGEIQYVTCGGGGAFLHPTHQLEDKHFEWRYPPPGVAHSSSHGPYQRSFTVASKPGGTEEALYPDRETSRGMTWRNLKFAIRNPGLTFVFLGAYLLYNWLLSAGARIANHPSLLHALSGNGEGSLMYALYMYARLSFVLPMTILLFLAAMGGYYYLADAPFNTLKRMKIGFLHGVAQAGVATLVTCLVIWSLGGWVVLHLEADPLVAAAAHLGVLLLAAALAALASATIFGIYLALNLNCWGRHWNEAFSALAIADFKCFLRLKIDSEGAASA